MPGERRRKRRDEERAASASGRRAARPQVAAGKPGFPAARPTPGSLPTKILKTTPCKVTSCRWHGCFSPQKHFDTSGKSPALLQHRAVAAAKDSECSLRPAYPQLALDFLLRPATMTSRQHSGPSFLQDEENSLGDGNTTAAREGTGMAVWRYGSCAGCSACSAKTSACCAPKSPPTRKSGNTNKMIVETTCCAFGNVRMR
jgi:hypothetical protein